MLLVVTLVLGRLAHALLSHVWWPGLSRDVSAFVRGCTIC